MDTTPVGNEEERWNEEAKRLQENLGMGYRNMHLIYVHPSGGKFYLGDSASASSKVNLKNNEITHIINCTKDLPLYHKDDPYFVYHRFVITDNFSWKTFEQIKSGFLPSLEWTEQALQDGKNVLSHCLAGAHRSAVFISCYLYWKVKRDKNWALSVVKKRRPISEPRLYLTAMDKLVAWIDWEAKGGANVEGEEDK